jgi:hypothetical protein
MVNIIKYTVSLLINQLYQQFHSENEYIFTISLHKNENKTTTTTKNALLFKSHQWGSGVCIKSTQNLVKYPVI